MVEEDSRFPVLSDSGNDDTLSIAREDVSLLDAEVYSSSLNLTVAQLGTMSKTVQIKFDHGQAEVPLGTKHVTNFIPDPTDDSSGRTKFGDSGVATAWIEN
jgi:hypothetical protein